MSRIFVFNTEFYFKFSKVRLAFLYKPSARYLNKLCILFYEMEMYYLLELESYLFCIQ